MKLTVKKLCLLITISVLLSTVFFLYKRFNQDSFAKNYIPDGTTEFPFPENRFFKISDTVTFDTLTGLYWQTRLGEDVSIMHSFDYCSSKNEDGHDDWRIPDLPELESLIDYSKGAWESKIDGRIFKEIYEDVEAVFLTSTSFINDVDVFFPCYVSFASGFTSCDFRVEYSPFTSPFKIICVRGEHLKTQSSFIKIKKEKDFIIEDKSLNVAWTVQTWEDKNSRQSEQRCEKLKYAGSSDWRLPNINELKTLFYIKNKPNSNHECVPAFAGISLEKGFRSSTRNTNYVWDFDDNDCGDPSSTSKLFKNYIRFDCITMDSCGEDRCPENCLTICIRNIHGNIN